MEPSSCLGAELSPSQPSHLPFTLMFWIRCRCLHLTEGEDEAQWGWPPDCPDLVVSAARIGPSP